MDELDDFERYVGNQDERLRFNNIVPMSMDIYDADDASQTDWCVLRWGTKWEPRACHRVRGRRTLYYFFRTAWTFPTPIIERLGELFPAVAINGHGVEESGEFVVVVRRGRVRQAEALSSTANVHADKTERQNPKSFVELSSSVRVAAGVNRFGDWFVPLVLTAKTWCQQWQVMATDPDEWVNVAEGWATSCFLGSAVDLATWAEDWVARDWKAASHRIDAKICRRVDWAAVALDMKAAGDIFTVKFRDGIAVFSTCKDLCTDR